MLPGFASLMASKRGAVPAAGIGTQTDSDNFNRANEHPIGGNWTSTAVSALMDLTSNVVVAFSLPGDAWAIRNSWASGDDQYSQAEITVVGTGAGTGFGVSVRHSTNDAIRTEYRLILADDGRIELLKFVAGVSSMSTIRNVTYVAGKKLGLSATGGATTTLKIWYDGVQIGADITDSSSPITTGIPAISYSSTSTSGSIDNWDAGTTP